MPLCSFRGRPQGYTKFGRAEQGRQDSNLQPPVLETYSRPLSKAGLRVCGPACGPATAS